MGTLFKYKLMFNFWFDLIPAFCFQMGYLRKELDGSLLYTVVNQLDPDAEGLLSSHSLLNLFLIFSHVTRFKWS